MHVVYPDVVGHGCYRRTVAAARFVQEPTRSVVWSRQMRKCSAHFKELAVTSRNTSEVRYSLQRKKTLQGEATTLVWVEFRSTSWAIRSQDHLANGESSPGRTYQNLRIGLVRARPEHSFFRRFARGESGRSLPRNTRARLRTSKHGICP